MDWSRIKTIFVITFLILDLYLMYEFLNFRTASQYELMTETTPDIQLKLDGIKYGELPKGTFKDNYLSATPRIFSKQELEKLENSKLKGQTVSIINVNAGTNDTTIESVLDKPIKISDKFDPAELNSFVKNQVISGEKYSFWEVSSKGDKVIYYQEYDGKSFYKNLSGELIFNVNEDREITSYTQSLLVNIKEMKEDEKILEPLKVIETLHKRGELASNSTVTKVELGYYTLVHLSTSQFLTPAWRVVVDEKKNIFVDAFEGKTITLNNTVE